MVLAFFGRIARAAAKQGLGDIAAACADPTGISAVNYLGKVAAEVWKDYRHDKKQEKLHSDILEAAKLTFEEAKQAGIAAAQEATTDPELQGHIERLVTLIPASIRASLRRPEDPTGTTLPQGFEVHDEQDLVKLLPVRLPRFKAGDTPLWLRGWRLVEQIGAGGFGEVWKVQNTRASNLLGAVKFSHGMSETEFSLLNEGDVLNRLLAEGEHDGIVPLQDLWAEGDPVPWIRFKYIDGGDLTTQIHRWQTHSVTDRLDKVISALSHLAKTIGYFHRLEPKIVHRDLKPSNILVEAKSGKLLISDFGIGVVSSTRAIRNERSLSQSQGAVIATYLRGSHTPLYASPQQKLGSRIIDPRDDVHAMGVIAYQMLTGQLDAAPGADLQDELQDRGSPDWLISLVKRCVARDPKRRPADGVEIEQLLKPTTEQPVVKPAPVVEEVINLQPEPVKPVPARVETLKAGDRHEITLAGGVTMAFAWCPPGSFQMGSNNGSTVEKPVHEVRLTKGFWTGIHPVTRGQFAAFVQATNYKTEAETSGGGWWYKGGKWVQDPVCNWRNPGFSQTDAHPVVVVSWNDAQAFARWASDQTGETLRLLTEAEWEYACRAGTITDYCSGNGEDALKAVGWFSKNSGGSTNPVGQLKANAWNLHDMHGNVWEWCSDWYDGSYYAQSSKDDPHGPTSGSGRVFRGGCWGNSAEDCRAAYRLGDFPTNSFSLRGFRLARVPSGSQ